MYHRQLKGYKMQYTRYSANLLSQAAELQERKSLDYQSESSTVVQNDYYIHGVYSILDIVNAKVLRTRSVLAKMEHGEGANFESVQDSMLDLINYASFLIAYLDGEIEGQRPDRDIFNRYVTTETETSVMPMKFRRMGCADE